MFWADRIAQEIMNRFGPKGPMLVRDEKTVSGRVHVGSMRGVAIHGAVADALAQKGVPVTFKWEFNDFDVFDSVPPGLPHETFEPFLGRLLSEVPSPDSSASTFAQWVANDFQSVMQSSGYTPEIYWGSELYLSGKMDGVIKEALEHADAIIRIYKDVSGSQKKPTWLPLAVVCPQCKKIATTDASDFDGKTVLVNCYETKAPYTKGCKFEGRVNPFGGNAKLTWKVEWPAKWKVLGVQVEGGGKDHSTKGGSRDVANHIAKEVFNYEPPFDIPYEFFLVGGKKMSSSKGRGSSAKEISDLLPPKIFRLALLSKDINQAFNFDPEGDTIPVLYDLYDKLAAGYWSGVKDDYARLFEMIHTDGQVPAQSALPRFSQVAFVVQMPHMDLKKEFPDANPQELDERAQYAKKWLAEYAPEKFVFKLQDTLPEVAKNLSEVQKKAMSELVRYIEQHPAMPNGEELHHKLHVMKEEVPIKPAELFSALYLLFLAKDHGPKAGWFLSALPRGFVLKRLCEV